MANKTDEQLLDSFADAAGKQTGGLDDMQSIPDEIAGVMRDSATTTSAADIESATQVGSSSNLYGESGSPLGVSVQGGSTATTTGSGGGSGAGSILEDYFEDSSGVGSIVSSLFGLFSGGSQAPPALEKYTMPSAISFESADTGGSLTASDFDQMGTPRQYTNADSQDAVSEAGTAGTGSSGGGRSSGGGSAATPQISLSVQTMDAQSFLDNSDQIAQAVRGAMLNLSSINDVINDL